MCESNVYLLKGGKEELIFKEVVKIVPEEDGFVLYGVLGESQKISGKIREMNLLSHKIVFEEENK
ncbi:MAG: CooT family nickel-binding protein [Dictyoglomus thermophilum]|nr:CooT family nickel-binding protein [Dictyoglomus thermophilum]MCX7721096.1 CooT family nickel-binding protein [Dictyoglomus thermophilum]